MPDDGAIHWLALFALPKTATVTSRTASLTNAFVNAIIPRVLPTAEEVREALSVLGMGSGDIECSYCGDAATEWDHLRPVVRAKRPTGYITEIRNLVPACGKCNQSKGAADWRAWMTGSAKLSPKSRGINGLDARMERLAAFENWGAVEAIKLDEVVRREDLERHWDNLERIIALMHEAQADAKALREVVATELARRGDEHVVIVDDLGVKEAD
jgi:hypothetical protein